MKTMKKMTTLAALALIGIVFLAAGCSKILGSDRISRANYDRISEGMTMQEVRDILGSPDETYSSGNTDAWTYSDQADREIIVIMFEDGQVLTKSWSDY
ncbi:MAG: outer membrane protein assembly factor BamE [Endomicrobium sp.]|jgi:outer membrane protein assembly factor BamE (lipoprotein component of BamABCDE complex)|nr:outer membrane protein assembly factor BamE [Endomicrobium sp.]